MIINNNLRFGFNIDFEIEGSDDKTKHLKLPEDRFIEISDESLPGLPPYTVKAEGGCGSAELSGVGAHDIVTYYQGYERDTGKGKNRLGTSSDIS